MIFHNELDLAGHNNIDLIEGNLALLSWASGKLRVRHMVKPVAASSSIISVFFNHVSIWGNNWIFSVRRIIGRLLMFGLDTYLRSEILEWFNFSHFMFLYDNSHGVCPIKFGKNMSHFCQLFKSILLRREITVIHCMFLFQLADLLI